MHYGCCTCALDRLSNSGHNKSKQHTFTLNDSDGQKILRTPNTLINEKFEQIKRMFWYHCCRSYRAQDKKRAPSLLYRPHPIHMIFAQTKVPNGHRLVVLSIDLFFYLRLVSLSGMTIYANQSPMTDDIFPFYRNFILCPLQKVAHPLVKKDALWLKGHILTVILGKDTT